MRRSILIPTLLILVLASSGAFWVVRDTLGGGLVISPDTLEFGDVTLGANLQQMVIATNTGSRTVAVDEITAPEGFAVSRGGFHLEPGQSVEVVVIFEPRSKGELAGDLRFAYEGRDVHRVALSGAVLLPPAIEVSPLAVSFGDVGVGHENRVECDIVNRGDGELSVEAFATVKPFRAEPSGLTIPAGESRTATLHFAPEALGRFSESMLVRSNDPARRNVEVKLAGKGVSRPPRAAIEVAPSSLAFGNVESCSGPAQWVTVRNTGSDALSLASLRYPAGFLGPKRSRKVAPGREFSFPVTFAPRVDGPRVGELVIFSNAPGQPTVKVALSGSGAPCDEATIQQIASRRPQRPGSEGQDAPEGGTFYAGASDARGFADDDFGPDLPGGVSYIGEGSVVKVLSYEAEVSDINIGSYSYDPLTGDLRIENIELPTVEAALDEYFTFESFDLVGRVDAVGELDIPAQLRVRDAYGNLFTIDGVASTETTVVMTPSGPVSVTGAPFGGGGDPILQFIGVCGRGTTCDGQVARLKLVLPDPEIASSQNTE